MSAPSGPAPDAAARSARRAAYWGLTILTAINLLNYVDRYVVPPIIDSMSKELHLSDTQAGSLMFWFVIVYMIASPFFGRMGDTRSRPRPIAAGVASWSIATSLAGFARGFVSLSIARAAVGIGEAAYGTIAPSLLADYFPKRVRGRAFAIFYAAIPVGSALGFVLGGMIDNKLGWRWAFYIAGIPGLLLAGLTLLLRDPPRGSGEDAADAAAHGHGGGRGSLASYLSLSKNRSYVLIVAGYTAYTFALGGLAWWMPSFLTRVRGVPKETASMDFGEIVVITGFIGTLVGGWIGDWLMRRTAQGYLWLSGVTTLAAIPFTYLAIASPDRPTYMAAIVAAELLLFASTGPINTAIVNVVAPEMRATAVAASIFCIHALGDAISPLLIGGISDAVAHASSEAGTSHSLGQAMLIIPFAVALSGALWTWEAARRR